jgi:hypothetical protein
MSPCICCKPCKLSDYINMQSGTFKARASTSMFLLTKSSLTPNVTVLVDFCGTMFFKQSTLLREKVDDWSRPVRSCFVAFGNVHMDALWRKCMRIAEARVVSSIVQTVAARGGT